MVGICADPGIHQVRRPARPFPDLRRSRWALAVASGTSWGHRRASAAILDAACALVGVCLTSWSGTPGYLRRPSTDARRSRPPGWAVPTPRSPKIACQARIGSGR